MSASMTCVGVLLAAGASRRFGSDDKLLASLNDGPLVTHAADALRAARVDHLIAVTRAPAVAEVLPGFEIVAPSAVDPFQSDSLRAGVSAAREFGAERLVVVLGDMPRVTTAMIDAVIEACADKTPSAMTSGAQPLPPACFPAAFFEDLMRLSGDRGAAALLAGATLIPASEQDLHDVDTPGALRAAQKPA